MDGFVEASQVTINSSANSQEGLALNRTSTTGVEATLTYSSFFTMSVMLAELVTLPDSVEPQGWREIQRPSLERLKRLREARSDILAI